MQFDSIWPYFICMAIVLAVAATPLLAPIDRFRKPGMRRSNIDGLRGFLAFGVVFHHAAVYHQYLLTGHWGPPPSPFYAALGPVSVSLFFMITAYLFWGRLIDKRGYPNWTDLYIGRIFRLFPLYLFAIAVMVLLVFIQSDFSLNVPLRDLSIQILRWSMGGIVSGPDINDHPHTSLLIAGVTWTLWFEWRFYAALLPLSLAAREGGSHLWFAIAGAVASLSYMVLTKDQPDAVSWIGFVALFFLGMACASLERRGLTLKLPNWCGSIIILVALLGCVTRSPDEPYSAWLALLLGLVFYLLVCGCDLFGLLTHRSALIIGDMSYGVYLLHGLVYAIVFASKPVAAFFLAAPIQHWAVVLACALVVLFVAAVAHVRIERVGIAYGKQFAAALDAMLTRRRQKPVPL